MEFIIKNKADLDKAILRASEQDLSLGWLLVFKQHEERRRDAQNRLINVFYSQIAKQSGNGVEYERGYYKWTYGCPILAKEDVIFNSVYCALMERYTYEEVIKIMGTDIVRVSSEMTVKQCAEYLTQIKENAESRGFTVTSNEDEYFKSLLTER